MEVLMNRAALTIIAFLGVSPLVRAQELPRVTYRDKIDRLEDELEKAFKKNVECSEKLAGKAEDMALVKTALANSERDHFRAEGKLAAMSENNDQLRRENADVRQRNVSMEFAMMRYSWAVAGEGMAIAGILVMVVAILLRLRKKRPQTQ
jgi:septal ring factor EnvC (AmiA/AmiB activator)